MRLDAAPGLKWVPALGSGVMHITAVYSETQTHPQSNRRQDNILTLLIIDAPAPDVKRFRAAAARQR